MSTDRDDAWSDFREPRSGCIDEIRMKPDRGKWHCRGWVAVALDDPPIRPPHDPGGPCTHRIVDGATSSWECWTRAPLTAAIVTPPSGINVVFGDLGLQHPPNVGPSVCDEELRTSPSHGRWLCASWKPILSMTPIQARDRGGGCTSRTVDQATGYWSCKRTTQLALPPGFHRS